MLEKTKKAFVELGKFLAQFNLDKNIRNTAVLHNDLFFDEFQELIAYQKHYNGWFVESEVYFAIQSWAEALTAENLDHWLSGYKIKEKQPKTVGLILAGNIPMVGFHDFLSVLVSGHKALVKTSSNDKKLLPFLANYLIKVEASLENRIEFIEGKLEKFDAVIATGSNNTSRYFEYYFRDKPSIIRKNRNSVAILTGNETEEDLIGLGKDIFTYFGLGCRNVSKIYVPEGYDFDKFFNAMYVYKELINNPKYINNYDYNKAVFLMSNFLILDNGFLVLKQDSGYSSPISSVFYENYTDLEKLKHRLKEDQELIQCVVGNDVLENQVGFGQTQHPELSDYADGIDTILFLNEI
jgi:hypothetical protein